MIEFFKEVFSLSILLGITFCWFSLSFLFVVMGIDILSKRRKRGGSE